MLCDFHLHSRFSGDCEAAPEAIVRQAVKLNMKAFCITDHLDMDFPGDLNFDLDQNAHFTYWKDMQALAKKDGLDVCIGMETGLEPYLSERLKAAVHKYPYDFIIGSSHLVHRQDPYYPEYFAGREEAAVYREYFESILENLKVCHDFDVYGHIDYIVRYGPNKNKFYSYEAYREIIDEILRILISLGKGIELNTGGFTSGLGMPNPCPEIIKRYRELGGEIITVGSDAHDAVKIGHHFTEAREILLDAGFRYYCIFKERKPVFLPVN
ncbi:MAG: histidinol-phosphatase HisJ family protein [Lachnospiraceae bacterium]|nr:histidinol-phosphatase HisJ family protein [Lachnospiraceae bacterium]